MFCKNCGKEVDDRAVVCPHCGVQVGQVNSNIPVAKSMCDLAIVGFILSFFIAIAGLVVSIIARKKCREENLDGEGFALAGIIISAASCAISLISLLVVIVIYVGYFSVLFSLIGGA